MKYFKQKNYTRLLFMAVIIFGISSCKKDGNPNKLPDVNAGEIDCLLVL